VAFRQRRFLCHRRRLGRFWRLEALDDPGPSWKLRQRGYGRRCRRFYGGQSVGLWRDGVRYGQNLSLGGGGFIHRRDGTPVGSTEAGQEQGDGTDRGNPFSAIDFVGEKMR